jgi:arsenate reductase
MMNKVLFLCPHHAAKSVMAAAYFNRLSAEHGLGIIADSAGTEPDELINPAVAELLLAEGFDVTGHLPRRAQPTELDEATRIISMGCNLDDLQVAPERVEEWTDVPMVSQDLPAARDAILRHVQALAAELAPRLT